MSDAYIVYQKTRPSLVQGMGRRQGIILTNVACY